MAKIPTIKKTSQQIAKIQYGVPRDKDLVNALIAFVHIPLLLFSQCLLHLIAVLCWLFT